jgi:molybdate transport system ATP-binding protein
MAELVHLNHLKSTPFKNTFSWTAKTCAYYTCRNKTPPLLILDEAVEGLDDENVAMIQLITLLSQQTNIAILRFS